MDGILQAVNAVRIFTRDLPAAHTFYGETLGLSEQSTGPGYVVFDLAGINIVLEAVDPDEPDGEDEVGRLIAASFTVGDVGAAYRTLQDRGVSFLQPPEKQAWGGTLAFALDPDRNIITLVG